MKNIDKTDHEIDMAFGQWLRDQRTKRGLSVEEVARQAAISADRLKSLELGYAEKGVTQPEAKKISAVYKVSLQELIEQASGETLNS